MTKLEAMAEAMARWGASATLIEERQTRVQGDESLVTLAVFSVGRLRPETSSVDVFGQGASWAHALADADKRARIETKRKTP